MIRALFQQIEMHLHKQISAHPSPDSTAFSYMLAHSSEQVHTEQIHTAFNPSICALCTALGQSRRGTGRLHGVTRGHTTQQTTALGLHQSDRKVTVPLCPSRDMSLTREQVSVEVSEPDTQYHRDALSKGSGEKSIQRSENNKNQDEDTGEMLLQSRRHRAQTDTIPVHAPARS